MAESSWGPEPVHGGVTLIELITNVGLLAFAVCGVGFLISASSTRTSGATRSAQLEWEQRQAQIDLAIQDQFIPLEADHEAVGAP